jgi:hypothetical protein
MVVGILWRVFICMASRFLGSSEKFEFVKARRSAVSGA